MGSTRSRFVALARGWLRSLPILAVVVALQGCADMGTFNYARDVGSAQPSRLGHVKGTVYISWRMGSPEWVSIMCQPMGKQGPPAHACAILDDDGENCVIFAVEPRDFQDQQRLAVLGHEAWHCFGAKHT